MDTLKFLHFDFDAFYASVEERERPELKNIPMVVGGRSQRGIITTANYKAREYGLHSAMPIFQAKKLCPHVVILPTRRDLYVEISEEIFDYLDDYSPKIEKKSIDEGVLDLSHIEEDPVSYARKIQQDIYEKTQISISLGLSFTKSFAKMASDWEKPFGLSVLKASEIPERIHPLPITEVHGIGPQTANKFYELGIFTIKDLYSLSEEELKRNFGKSGLSIYKKIRGLDREEVKTTRIRKSLGVERTFKKNIPNKKTLEEMADFFAIDLYKELKNRRLIAKTYQIKIKFQNFSVITRSFTLNEATRELEDLRRIYKHLLEEVDFKMGVRLYGFTAANLQSDEFYQLDLFHKK